MINGLDRLYKKLNQLEKLEAVRKGITKSCIIVEADAKDNCPRDNGQLVQSITHIPPKAGGELVGIIGTNLEYAPYVELGTGLFAANGDGRKDVPWSYKDAKGEWHTTSGQHPQPFLAPALQKNAKKISKIIQDAYKEAGKNG